MITSPTFFNSVFKQQVTKLLAEYEQIFIAYSGGVDSHVLLHLLATNWAKLKKPKNFSKLTAIHINHNLNPHAENWVKHCRRICEQMEVRLIVKKLPLENREKTSLEEHLRNLRYASFAETLPHHACLATAHQRDDQAETLLLQLFRGAGVKGLAAMAKKTTFAKGWLERPLLNIPRAEILKYALEHQLNWIEDESNSNFNFDRNYIRHQLLPVIQKKWPAINKTLSRVSKHCAETQELIDTLAQSDIQQIQKVDQNILHLPTLKNFSLSRQKNLLRLWFRQLHLPIPSEAKLKEIDRGVVNARYDAQPLVTWPGAMIRRFNNYLYAMPSLPSHDNKTILWFTKQKLNFSSVLGNITISVPPQINLDKLKIVFRQGGERVKLPNHKFTHDLKKLMQKWKIPPWLRERIPLVCYNEQIVAVVGYYSIDWLKIKIS